MLLVEVHNMKAQEKSNNADAETTPTWSATATYGVADRVVLNGYVYYSVEVDNKNHNPSTTKLYWRMERTINRDNVYDVYPDTFTKKTSGNLILEFDVVAIDTIFLGNIHGNSVTVTAGGTFTKTISSTTISPITVWGLQGYVEIADFYIELTAYTGAVKIEIVQATSDSESALGFINYGVRTDAGCTLLDSIEYNVRSGVAMTGNITKLDRLRKNSWLEMILPIRVPKVSDTPAVISLLAKYRGSPILIIGDDLGVREETIFYGVYTEIEANIAEWNTYTITLRSLKYEAFVPPTIIEKYLDEHDAAVATLPDPTPRVHAITGIPTCSDFDPTTRIIYNSSSPRDVYYCLGNVATKITPTVDAFTFTPNAGDFTAGTKRSVIFKGCKQYILDGGIVKECKPSVGYSSTLPVSSDFSDGTGTSLIFYNGFPYAISGGAIKRIMPSVDYTTTVPTITDFTDNTGRSVIFTGCDHYINDAGTVKKCYPNVDSSATVPVIADFTKGTGRDVIFVNCEHYINDAGTVKKCYPKIDSSATVPVATDFTKGTGRDVIFVGGTPYYLTGGVVGKKLPRINGMAGVPTITDFTTGTGSDIIFNSLQPCDHYYQVGGIVKKCVAKVDDLGVVPTVTDFTDTTHSGRSVINNGCKTYINDSGTIKECVAKVDDLGVVPTVTDFTDTTHSGRSVINNGCKTYINDSGTIKECVAKVDDLGAVPTLADFTDTTHTGRSVINNGCKTYINDGGTIKECVAKVDSVGGVPTLADFNGGTHTGRSVINNGCDTYINNAGTVKKCTPKVTSYVGTPPLSLFTGGVKFAFDEANPCDLYYNKAGTVTKCGGGGGVSKGVAISQGNTFSWNTHGVITGVTKGVSDLTISITAVTAGSYAYTSSNPIEYGTYPSGTSTQTFLDHGEGVITCYSD